MIAEEISFDNEDIPVLVPFPCETNSNDNEIVSNNNNISKQDNERQKLLLRRETRKKKVLENAKDRLAKLNGRDFKHSNCGSAEEVSVSDPEIEPDIPQLMRADMFNVHTQGENMPDLDFSTLLGRPNMLQQNAKVPRFWQKSRLHVLLAALVTCILHVSGYSWTMGISIFGIFGLCITTELLFCTRQKDVDPMVNLVIMFSGIPPRFTHYLMNFVLVLYNVFTDMGIFIFWLCAGLISYNTFVTHKDGLDFIKIK